MAVLAFVTMGTSASAQTYTYTDTVCGGSQNVVYGISNPTPNSTYDWYLASGGTLDTSITNPDTIIQVDWDSTAGTYTLYAVETSANGCIGDSVQLDIVINALPTAIVAMDSVCEGFSPTMMVSFTGEAPWYFDYEDGNSNTFSDTANSSPYVVSLPPQNSSTTVSLTSLTDGNGCAADPAGLPTNVPVNIYAKPNTGAIFHY